MKERHVFHLVRIRQVIGKADDGRLADRDEMARKTIEQRLAELEARRSALKARLSKQERTHDTRRKILIGALILQRLETSRDTEFTRRLSDWLRRELPAFLTRDNDRAIFAGLLGDEEKAGSGRQASESQNGPGLTVIRENRDEP
jgi:chromosome condensin MukBEF ATPase and DNA-binding subunit MukB